MFVLEKVSKNDMELYKRIDNKIRWTEWLEKHVVESGSAKWCADRERGYYLICTGQRADSPHFFKMNYKNEIIEISVYDKDDISWSDGFADIWVYIPGSLSDDKDDISRLVREMHADNVFGQLFLFKGQEAQIKDIQFRIKESLS